MNRKVLAVFCGIFVICVVFSLVWLHSQQEAPAAAETKPEQKALPIDLTHKQIHGDDLAFTATLDDLICSYNGVFCQRSGKDFFPGVNHWNSTSLSKGIHSPYPARQFYFCQDETVLSLPTVTVYTPLEERCIQEITINFDEHSHTDLGYQQYQELCLCAILTFFPEFSLPYGEDLCERILQLGNQNVYDSNAWFGYNSVPCAIFHRNGVGLYPYEAIGDWRRFCIIPVTAERLEAFRQKGAVIHELEDADPDSIPVVGIDRL